MKLTIGMIVKNEEKWLDKCLSAIKPILDSVDSELIITDTGSTDHTVETAKKYTDKILHFDWVNDFSAARNTGIEAAKGEWFMFLDADEIFISCQEIIDFFNSGEYKRYKAASYIIRDLAGDGTFNDFSAKRLAKLAPDTHFDGIIHERLHTEQPVKHLSDIAEHYGYIFSTESDRIAKFERNYSLLKEKYDKVKNTDPMIYAEMYDTLAVGFKQKEADEYLEKGIRWCIKHEHPVLVLLYCKKARHLLFEKRTVEALNVCDDYFGMSSKIRSQNLYSDVEIIAVKATALYRLGKYNETIAALSEYFRLYEELKKGKLDTNDKMYGSLSLASDHNYLSYVGQFLVCCTDLGKHEFAAMALSKLPIYKYSANRGMLNSVISLEASVLKKVDHSYYDKFSKQLDDYGKNELKKVTHKPEPKKNTGKIILTIGMIVKNEEKYLDRCLSAIKPILDNVDSELIITDTGSTDRTVEIAKKFTDKVLHFDWINDFAAARNFGLEKAQGEWFMFVDADDIFRSCDNIIRFFNSGEYKKYNSATYVSSNFTNDINTVTVYRAQRLTRIKPNTKFEGIVHELMNTFGSPVKHLADTADHYGYIYTDKSDAAKKSKRNIELLLKRYQTEKNPDPIIFSQLHDSYLTGDDEKNALKYLNIGIDHCKARKHIVLAVLYVRKAFYEISKDQYENAIQTCYEYLNMDRVIREKHLTSDREIYAILATSLLRQKNYTEAETAFDEFFNVFEMTNNGTLDTPDSDAIHFFASADHNYLPFVNAFLHCCFTNGHYEHAAEKLCKLPVYKYSENKEAVNELINSETMLIEKLGLHYVNKFLSQLDEYGTMELKKAVEKLKPKQGSNDEMAKLSAMLKSNVRNMIANGNHENARRFLSEYQKINPSDPEITELMNMIR